ncbi:short-chain dehydrogenase [Colletotrichum truncatum]|uniref:Short-chain dehydrogenase n=1 Tax=Colletotrichum truncatum TaxID=5467 RepID=A0ACC3ZLY2_COLTU
MSSLWSTFFPSKPSFTETNLPDQSGKVLMITGASGGLGKELAKILFQKNAKIYMAARSKSKTTATIEEIKKLYPLSRGTLEYLYLDLTDLGTVKKSAEEFLAKESRLDVLWNNAGVMIPPQGSQTAQGYELQLGVNVLGPFLFTTLVRPALSTAAKSATKGSVRVVWVSSSAVAMAPSPPIDFNNMDYDRDESAMTKYTRSKAGTVLHANEFARRTIEDGIISISLDPGLYMTDLQRTMPRSQKLFVKVFGGEPINGAYTELFAGLSPAITEKDSGGWVVPNGRLKSGREDFRDSKLGKQYWEWTMAELQPYLQ